MQICANENCRKEFVEKKNYDGKALFCSENCRHAFNYRHQDILIKATFKQFISENPDLEQIVRDVIDED